MQDQDIQGLRTWAEVDYEAIRHNLKEIRKLVGDTKIMGIVKADAYGHGASECARVMEEEGVDYFAVACLAEAISLRQSGLKSPILILGWTDPADFDQLVKYDLIQTAVSAAYARELSAYGQRYHSPMKVHVKVDTGMNRTGILFQPEEKRSDELLEVFGLPGLDIQGMFTHFPVSDDLQEESMSFTRRQIGLFREAVQVIKAAGFDPGLLHVQNSYGILNYKDLGMNYCRPGLLYMGVTSDDAVEILSNPDFIPILTLKTRVSMVKDLKPGATVSYGRHYKVSKPVKIASLCIGYADGLPRACSNKELEVLIHGKKARVVGNICMDQCMADVTDIPDVKEGDVAIVIGRDGDQVLSVDAISRMAGTINNETLTRLTARVPRIQAEHK